MKKTIAIIKLTLLGAVLAITLTAIRAQPAEASFYCVQGNSRCNFGIGEPLIYKRIWIP